MPRLPSGYDHSSMSSSGSSSWLWEDDPYKAADLFAVVRDPMERQIYQTTISFVASSKERAKPSQCDTADTMTPFCQGRLQVKPSATEVYFHDGYHWIIVYDYMIRPDEIRLVDYVFPMDNDFPGNW